MVSPKSNEMERWLAILGVVCCPIYLFFFFSLFPLPMFFTNFGNTSEMVSVNVSIFNFQSVRHPFHSGSTLIESNLAHKENEKKKKPISVQFEPQKWSIFRILLLFIVLFWHTKYEI